jgi:hypothetical protein
MEPPWLQPVATSRKSDRRGSRKNKPKPSPLGCDQSRAQRTVRRGSPVESGRGLGRLTRVIRDLPVRLHPALQ